ncbi:MAG: hypothetical protein RBT69_07500 [Spirochaetia bacterium]|jgi:hypothetical protein|nr:hypothetical protein [Spirochaetia bacterium]
MEREVVELFQKGMEMMQVGEYQIAEQLFRKARDLTIDTPQKV